MKKVRVEDAVGMVLGHDLTKIVPGSYKGPAFRKGHIIKEEDIPHLKDIGKEHIYLIELPEDKLHENEAAARVAASVSGPNTQLSPAAEGRVNITAAVDGLLKINRQAIAAVNRVENLALSTRHTHIVVKAGELVAAVKIIPLVIDQEAVLTAEEQAKEYGPVIQVKPLNSLKVGIVITGNEVYYGRIQDRFAPVLKNKMEHYGAEIIEVIYSPDDPEQIRQAIMTCQEKGAQLIIASGGMSVDPDDVTPEAIRLTGARVVLYGTPVLPGAMFMLAYLGSVTLMGLPACGMYSKTTVLDLVLPRVLAGERLTKEDIISMGYGGLCMNCKECIYPHCPFGK